MKEVKNIIVPCWVYENDQGIPDDVCDYFINKYQNAKLVVQNEILIYIKKALRNINYAFCVKQCLITQGKHQEQRCNNPSWLDVNGGIGTLVSLIHLDNTKIALWSKADFFLAIGFPGHALHERIYRDKTATFHWSAANNRERFSSR